MNTIEMQYHNMCKEARDESRRDGCTKHVNAHVGIVDGAPAITGFSISDWYDGSTIATFTDGEKH